ncbi:MAG: phospholipase D-like domain-containing protein [Pseudomonadales bacterium]
MPTTLCSFAIQFTLIVLCTGGCVYLPSIEKQTPSNALAANTDSRIARFLEAAAQSQSERALLIDSPEFALTSRLDLIDAADDSIDLQYFIWQNDSTGILVIEKILEAADRGVRVRALVDDVQLNGLVNRLNALNDHANIEIRIFNPFSIRWRYELGILRLAEFAIDGNRLNHRMHNKLLVVDNQLAVLGGRNIGDDYFGKSTHRNFIDLDILLSGSIIPELSQGFDTYWNSQWAYPVNELLDLTPVPDQLKEVRLRIRKRIKERPEIDILAKESTVSDTLMQISQGSEIRKYVVVVDDPDVSWFDKPDELVDDLTAVALRAEREILIVTPYLIPTPELINAARKLISRGVNISIVTNSLETNDVVIAQAAYSHYRKRVVEAGISLYEMRGDADVVGRTNVAKNISLHTKYIIFDEDKVFMGSFNLDPRSLYLNTELGVVLDSPALAKSLRSAFYRLTESHNSWKILKGDNGVRWQSADETFKRTPAKNLWQRFRYWIYRLLPVSRQL